MSEDMQNVIQEVLEVSRFAPSSHNTQPWFVEIDDFSIRVGFKPERQLTVGDPNKRELFISLGCFIQSILFVSEDFGLQATYRFHGEKPSNVATISFKRTGTPSRSKDHVKLVHHRRSDRRLYEKRKLPTNEVDGLRKISASKASLYMIDESKVIDFLGDKTYEATLETMLNPAFREELATWVRNNWTKKPDGMPAYTQGMPGPISLIAKFVIKKNKAVAKDQAKKDSKRVKHSAAIGLICVSKEIPAEWIAAGMVYQAAALYALQHNVKSAAVSAAVILPKTAKEIQKELKLSGSPVSLLRFGFTKDVPRVSPRLTVRQITKR